MKKFFNPGKSLNKQTQKYVRTKCETPSNESNFPGDSASSAELLLHEHKKLVPEARQLQERAIKITKATEQLVASGCFAGEQATAQAYTVLSATSDYLTDLDARESLLTRAITFFRNAHAVITNYARACSPGLCNMPPPVNPVNSDVSIRLSDIPLCLSALYSQMYYCAINEIII